MGSKTALEKAGAALACPRCRSGLALVSEGAGCTDCGLQLVVENGQLRFPELLRSFTPAELDDDPLRRGKERIKNRAPGLYEKLVEIVSPVHFPGIPREFLADFDLDKDVVLDLGCGSFRREQGTLNVDVFGYGSVDVVCPIDELPFRDGSVDGVVSVAVLEHVRDPHRVVAEMHRVLKPGGRVYCYVPFMQGAHASPHDFQRYTQRGMEVLFEAFAESEVEVAAGPSSGFVWMLQEWLAITFSFGSRKLYWAVYCLAFALSPLKFLDVLLRRHPMAANIASAFAVRAVK